jgi:integrase/recombinase XerD
MDTNPGKKAARLGPLTAHVESVLESLPAIGYGPEAVTRHRRIIDAFTRWINAKHLSVENLGAIDVLAFLRRRPRRRVDSKERATLRKFLTHLRARGVCSPPSYSPTTPADDLTQRYVAFLRQDRGLAENSIAVYAPCARDFFAYCTAKAGRLVLETLDANTVRTFLLRRITNRSTESSRLLSVALRSVLRFLFLRGETRRDLSSAVPMVRTYRHSGVPALLSPEEVERVVATPDTSNLRGRRDAAILLLLARLGLRASEIVHLELDDLRWRAGEIVIRGKGPQRDHVPLVADVGAAIARYLQRRCRAAVGRSTHRNSLLHVSIAEDKDRYSAHAATRRRNGPAPARRRPHGDCPVARP